MADVAGASAISTLFFVSIASIFTLKPCCSSEVRSDSSRVVECFSLPHWKEGPYCNATRRGEEKREGRRRSLLLKVRSERALTRKSTSRALGLVAGLRAPFFLGVRGEGAMAAVQRWSSGPSLGRYPDKMVVEVLWSHAFSILPR